MERTLGWKTWDSLFTHSFTLEQSLLPSFLIHNLIILSPCLPVRDFVRLRKTTVWKQFLFLCHLPLSISTPQFQSSLYSYISMYYFFTSIQVWFSSSVVEAVLKMNLSRREPLPWKGINASFWMQRLISQELVLHWSWYTRHSEHFLWPVYVGPDTVSCLEVSPKVCWDHMIFQGSAQLELEWEFLDGRTVFLFLQVVSSLTSRTMSGIQETLNKGMN